MTTRGRIHFVVVAAISVGVVSIGTSRNELVSAEGRANTVAATATKALSTVAPRVITASSTAGSPEILIAEMSPDTGVYSVQWVPLGEDFNSYQMTRVTAKKMTLPNYFVCLRSYTFRIFVMASDWQLTDGHQTQNVTPHSSTFILTMPSCTSSASTVTTSSLSCANGGACVVGDAGPGGGIVFYVASSNFTSTGSTCATACRYLETAPTGWGNGIFIDDGETTGTASQDPKLKWCSANTTLLNVSATGIGTGMTNTTTADTTCTTGAIQASADYVSEGKTDWYLPSQFELNELCKYARQQATGNTATICASTGSLRPGFSAEDYWASTEGNATQSCAMYFVTPSLNCARSKGGRTEARPIRAFG